MVVMAPGIIIHSCKTLEVFWNMLPFHSDLSGKYDLDPFSHSSTLKIPLLQSTWTQIASDFLMAVSFPLLFRLRFSSFLTECKPRKRRSTLARSLDQERMKNHEESMHVGCQIGLHPPSLTWNLKMMVSKRNLLFHWLIFRFHVKLQGSTSIFPKNRFQSLFIFTIYCILYTIQKHISGIFWC